LRALDAVIAGAVRDRSRPESSAALYRIAAIRVKEGSRPAGAKPPQTMIIIRLDRVGGEFLTTVDFGLFCQIRFFITWI
jgi:hypothetical protein